MTSEPQDISRAVVCWLEYKSLTGMNGLFSEASLAVPISEFLSRRHGGQIKSEVAHPLFASQSRGRPRQIDFVREANGNKTWLSAYECKFQNISLSDIINDICRLICLSLPGGIKCKDRYFIFARKLGEANILIDKEINIGKARLSTFDKILLQQEVYIGQKNSFKIRELHQNQQDVFNRFSKEYGVNLPSQMVTKLCGMSRGLEYACAIWRISSESGSRQKALEAKVE
jgi:hypothetical protein